MTVNEHALFVTGLVIGWAAGAFSFCGLLILHVWLREREKRH